MGPAAARQRGWPARRLRARHWSHARPPWAQGTASRRWLWVLWSVRQWHGRCLAITDVTLDSTEGTFQIVQAGQRSNQEGLMRVIRIMNGELNMNFEVRCTWGADRIQVGEGREDCKTSSRHTWPRLRAYVTGRTSLRGNMSEISCADRKVLMWCLWVSSRAHRLIRWWERQG